MTTLYTAETTLQHILGMRVGDELQLAGGDLPEYTEDDAGKALQVNQAGTGLEWGLGVPEYTSSDVGKVLTLMTASSSVVPMWGRGSINVLALSNTAVMDLQSTFASTLTSMISGGKKSIVSSEANFSTTDDKEAVLAAIENGVNGVISVIELFGSKLIIPSYNIGENEGSLVFNVPFYTLLQSGTEYSLRITIKIMASIPSKIAKFAYTVAIEQIDYHSK